MTYAIRCRIKNTGELRWCGWDDYDGLRIAYKYNNINSAFLDVLGWLRDTDCEYWVADYVPDANCKDI